MIRPVSLSDASYIANIYNYYIQNSTVTFEEKEVNGTDIQSRIEKVISAGLPWLLAEHRGQIVGYAYATPWKERSAYRFSVEISVYVAHQHHGEGWGSKLYDSLFDELRKREIHLVIGGITLPNEASIALHEKFEMQKVAHFKEIGFKFDKWLDVGYWQRKL